MKDKIIFLDFDGVVNTPIWRNYIEDGKEVLSVNMLGLKMDLSITSKQFVG